MLPHECIKRMWGASPRARHRPVKGRSQSLHTNLACQTAAACAMVVGAVAVPLTGGFCYVCSTHYKIPGQDDMPRIFAILALAQAREIIGYLGCFCPLAPSMLLFCCTRQKTGCLCAASLRLQRNDAELKPGSTRSNKQLRVTSGATHITSFLQPDRV